MKTTRFFVYSTLVSLLLIAGCSKKEEVIKSEKELYDHAYSALAKGRFESAIERYEELTNAYPYGVHATQGELEICYAYYKAKYSDAAVPCLNEFLSLHPTHSHIDYAYYLKGLASLPIRPPKFGEKYFKTQEQFSDHDADAARDAYAAFTEVVNRFPLSAYADSARQILIDLINTFARHDLRIARFHLYREAYVGGINRAKRVLERYETSPHTEEALAILVYAYEKLDLPDLAAENRRVLVLNFPSSEFIGNEHRVLDEDIIAKIKKPLLFGLFR